jgi:glycosyltransferase involved in cell wall biosynthesis
MILFLNFAPISFMGGAEKWMNETAKKVNQHEETFLVSVAGNIASLYSSLVLKRKFDSRANAKDIHDNLSLDLSSFVPFTSKWNKARQLFQKSRLIYARYELPEFVILLYFSGLSGLKKTIAGLHSPFIYANPESFFDHLHNLVYSSSFSKKLLSSVKKVHVLNKRDFKLFSKDYHFKNIEYVPNGMPEQTTSTTIKQDHKLHILYVGELSRRKGVDRLIEVVKNSPKHFIFTIAGDGTMQPEIQNLAKEYPNCIYKGFVSPSELSKLYKTNEVLFLPSRAESMPLSILEAMSFGLVIVDSDETNLQLTAAIEYSSVDNKFLDSLNKIFLKKKQNKISVASNKEYFNNNFSKKVVDPLFFKSIFNFNI